MVTPLSLHLAKNLRLEGLQQFLHLSLTKRAKPSGIFLNFDQVGII